MVYDYVFRSTSPLSLDWLESFWSAATRAADYGCRSRCFRGQMLGWHPAAWTEPEQGVWWDYPRASYDDTSRLRVQTSAAGVAWFTLDRVRYVRFYGGRVPGRPYYDVYVAPFLVSESLLTGSVLSTPPPVFVIRDYFQLRLQAVALRLSAGLDHERQVRDPERAASWAAGLPLVHAVLDRPHDLPAWRVLHDWAAEHEPAGYAEPVVGARVAIDEALTILVHFYGTALPAP